MHRETAPGLFEAFTSAVFVHPNGNETPRAALELWSDAALAAIGFYRPQPADEPPADKVVVSQTVKRIGGVVRFVNILGDRPLEAARAEKLAAIVAAIDYRLAAGAPVGELHVALDDGSRADMTAMGTTAIAAASGALPWPDSYSQGWITIENIRIPLPTPADGLGLAANVGDFYAQIRQHGRDLKDLVEAATTIAELDAIDETAGQADCEIGKHLADA